MSISDLRREYALTSLNEQDLDPSPFRQFEKWFQQALSAELLDANAMTLATANRDGKPSARIMLMKDFDENGFVFFSNYESRKGRELDENPYAAMVFYWAELERQVRIHGKVSRVPKEESEEYFHSRPEGSQLAAWASHQSEVISQLDVLETRIKTFEAQFKGKTIPPPPHWGGYLLVPQDFEFWQGRPNRLHDRFRYTLQQHSRWRIERLSP